MIKKVKILRDSGKTLQSVGDMYGVSREYVRLIGNMDYQETLKRMEEKNDKASLKRQMAEQERVDKIEWKLRKKNRKYEFGLPKPETPTSRAPSEIKSVKLQRYIETHDILLRSDIQDMSYLHIDFVLKRYAKRHKIRIKQLDLDSWQVVR